MKYLFALILFCSAFFAKAESITIGATQWHGYTNLDHSGVYFDLLKEVFNDYQINVSFSPFHRLNYSFEKDQFDLVIGVFREDIPNGHFPKWHLDYEYPIVGFYNKSQRQLTEISQLQDLTLSWLRGYRFERYIDYPHNAYMVNSHEDGFKLLLKNRTDVFVDYIYNFPVEYKDKLGILEVFPARPIFIAFKNNKRGKQLAAIYDKKLSELRASGRLEALYKEDYARTNFEQFNPDKPKIIIQTSDTNLLRMANSVDLDSLESRIFKLLLKNLTSHSIEFIKTNDIVQLHELNLTDNTCLSNMIKTEARQQQFLFSKPMFLYAGLKVYSKNDLSLEGQVDLPSYMLQHPEQTIGLVDGQQYDANILNIINSIDSSQIVSTDLETFRALTDFKNDKFSLRLEYPAVMNAYWKIFDGKPLYSYSVAGIKPFTLSHLMCVDSEQTKRFLTQIDQTLTTLYQSEIFINALQKDSGITDKTEFEQLYKTAFGQGF